MFRPHFNIVFFGGGEMGKYLEWTGFRGKHSKIRHTTSIFLNIFVQDWRLAQWWEHSLHTDVAWIWISEITPFLVWFYVLPRENIPNSNSMGNFKPRTRMSLMHYHLIFVCLCISSLFPSFCSLHPFDLRSTIHLFARRLFHAAMDRGRFPFTKNSGLKFWKFHVPLSGTVHTGCTDVTETTEGLIPAKYNTRAKIKQKSPEKRLTR